MICQKVQADCFCEIKKTIQISKNTVLACANGQESICEFNANTKHWLTLVEEEAIVHLSKRRLLFSSQLMLRS